MSTDHFLLNRERSPYRYIAIIMGLAGNLPATVDIDGIASFIRDVEETERLSWPMVNRQTVGFPRRRRYEFPHR